MARSAMASVLGDVRILSNWAKTRTGRVFWCCCGRSAVVYPANWRFRAREGCPDRSREGLHRKFDRKVEQTPLIVAAMVGARMMGLFVRPCSLRRILSANAQTRAFFCSIVKFSNQQSSIPTDLRKRSHRANWPDCFTPLLVVRPEDWLSMERMMLVRRLLWHVGSVFARNDGAVLGATEREVWCEIWYRGVCRGINCPRSG